MYRKKHKRIKKILASLSPPAVYTVAKRKKQKKSLSKASYQDIPDNASKEDFNQIFGAGLSDEAFNVYSENFYSDLWNSIRTQDVAYYSYDNNLGLSKIGVDESHSIDLANVSFSNSGAHTMYAQQDANVRSAATTLSTAFDGIGEGQDITVTGLANGWYRVGMNGSTAIIGDLKDGDVATIYFYSGEHGIN